MKNVLTVLALLLFVVSVSSCEKYDEGGIIDDTDKNIKAKWKVMKYIRNGTDETKSLLFYNYAETYSDGGKYTRNYMAEGNKPVSESGTWSFDKGAKKINLSGLSPIDIITSHRGATMTSLSILRLQDNEFWYTFSSGGDTHQFRLIK